MFYDEDHDYDDEDLENFDSDCRKVLITAGCVLAFFLTVLLVCAACSTQQFQNEYRECIAAGGGTMQCAQE